MILEKEIQVALSLKDEESISFIMTCFSDFLKENLNMIKVRAPLCVFDDTGINDDLNGTEAPVSFFIKEAPNRRASVVHSLAKWKRIRLAELCVNPGQGIYTDMIALRPDESLGKIHSVLVDQWDWEITITESQRNIIFLKSIVNKIYEAIRKTEQLSCQNYTGKKAILPEKIFFIQAEELLRMYPDLSPKERENEVAKKWGAVFIIGIGGKLSNGYPHDGRAPDYDDWTTETHGGYCGLNGDIIVWNPITSAAFEISSMGIRVNDIALLKQLKICNSEYKKDYLFHKMLLNGVLPLSIGGGIGQSRLLMFLLGSHHIAEVQQGLWP